MSPIYYSNAQTTISIRRTMKQSNIKINVNDWLKAASTDFIGSHSVRANFRPVICIYLLLSLCAYAYLIGCGLRSLSSFSILGQRTFCASHCINKRLLKSAGNGRIVRNRLLLCDMTHDLEIGSVFGTDWFVCAIILRSFEISLSYRTLAKAISDFDIEHYSEWRIWFHGAHARPTIRPVAIFRCRVLFAAITETPQTT